MKKVLLASTALVLSAGVVAADVTVGGDGRMGVLKRFGTDDISTTSRIRISFTASGETDGGLSFGGSIRADNAGGIFFEDENGDNVIDIPDEVNAGGGAQGLAGSVFVSGAFGTISFGDVSGAPEAAVGDLSGVGLTGLGDLNEATYISNANRPAVRYDYSFGDFGVHLSVDNPVDFVSGQSGDEAMGAAVTYAGGMWSVGLGYETNDTIDHIIGGGSVTFGDATVKAFFGTASITGASDADQYGVSLDYTFGATTATAFYMDKDAALGSEAWGLGAAYDLGGGAAVKAGYASNESTNDDSFDFGLSMSF